MSKNFEHIIHKNSSVVVDGAPKLPTSSQVEYGELAVNYAKGLETISLKNSNNEIVTFSSDNNFVKIADFDETEHAIAASLNDLDAKIKENSDDADSKFAEINQQIEEMSEEIENDGLVTSSAINDLNSRLDSSENDIQSLGQTVSGKQDALISGTNIKTVNNESLLGSGNVSITGSTITFRQW